MTRMRPLGCPSLLGLLLTLAACGEGDAPDAYGNFEATEVTVSAEAQGRLVRLGVDEGDRLAVGAVVGLVDTTQLAIRRRAVEAQRRSLLAQHRATLAQRPEVEARAAEVHARLATAERELTRTRRLHRDRAATERELERAEGEVAALREQLRQARARATAVDEQAAAVAAQVEQAAAQIAELAEQAADARVVNPVAGTVLAVVARGGETVQPGAPLYTVADLDTLRLRAYATGTQLPRLRLGQRVDVRVDEGAGGLRTLPGTVTWIAADAQFTPTPIQTRDERAELVYAFDVRVPNLDGLLKVGMPGEVRLPELDSRMGAWRQRRVEDTDVRASGGATPDAHRSALITRTS